VTTPTGSEPAGKSLSSAVLGLTIVRACARCDAPRTPGRHCAACGNSDPPETTDLGTVAAAHRNPLKQRWWDLIGRPLAERRIRKAAARTLQLRRVADPHRSDSSG
jgi:hypothetical protein